MNIHWKATRPLCGAIAGALMNLSAVAAPTFDIPLKAAEGFSAASIQPVGNGRYCISGNVYDDAGPSTSARVLLVDTTNKRTLWSTAIAHGRDYADSSAVACAAMGDAFYVVSQEQTGGAESQNQTRVVISRLSAQGKVERQQTIEAGFDEWFYGLDAGPAGVTVIGGTSATVARGGPFGTFAARFDAALAPGKLTKLANGAFWTETAARLADTQLYVSGQFMSNPGAGRDAYASAKIDLGSGKYVWSTYPLPDDTNSALSWFAPDGTTYTAALTPTKLAVVALDRQGKTTSSFAVQKTLCTLKAVTLDGQTLRVAGTTCSSESPGAIVSVDMRTHSASAPRVFDGRLRTLSLDGGNWLGVAKAGEQGLSLQRGDD
ncbi:hypothetical protein [Paraburkholderia bannensis]|uniref:hypothetical protein n=1 Tax=Paraburkholderia bannensis TaxID=765414 RepID=UPI002AC3655D|nr:hypothetical protein [Paraburkholderia bannensis]